LFPHGRFAAVEERPAEEEHRCDESKCEWESNVPAWIIEADDEGQEVKGQRQDPEKRNHGDVLTEFVRGGQEQH